MPLSKVQQLARLVGGAVYNVARQFAQKHGGSFRGFWAQLRSTFGLTTSEATALAREGRLGVQAARGLGSTGVPFDSGNPNAIPLNPQLAPDYETPDRLHYHVQLRYTRGSDGSIQNRTVNVLSDVPLTNQDLQAAAEAELAEQQARKQGSPSFNTASDTMIDWVVDWLVAFRPLP